MKSRAEFIAELLAEQGKIIAEVQRTTDEQRLYELRGSYEFTSKCIKEEREKLANGAKK